MQSQKTDANSIIIWQYRNMASAGSRVRGLLGRKGVKEFRDACINSANEVRDYRSQVPPELGLSPRLGDRRQRQGKAWKRGRQCSEKVKRQCSSRRGKEGYRQCKGKAVQTVQKIQSHRVALQATRTCVAHDLEKGGKASRPLMQPRRHCAARARNQESLLRPSSDANPTTQHQ